MVVRNDHFTRLYELNVYNTCSKNLPYLTSVRPVPQPLPIDIITKQNMVVTFPFGRQCV